MAASTAHRVVCVSLGDPDGIGPELLCRVLNGYDPGDYRLVLVGPEAALAAHLTRRGQTPFYVRLDAIAQAAAKLPGIYLYQPPELEGFDPKPGAPRVEGGRAAGLALLAVTDALGQGQAAALVTCPLNKHMLGLAGFDFPGHTEFLAERAGLAPDAVCMHLCGDILRVSLLTTHPALRKVPDLISGQQIVLKLTLTWEFLTRLGLDGLPIGVCGLNPHAGEGGSIGREEIEIIAPAVEKARGLGISAMGPLPADTLFFRAARGEFAAVLAMYHDQGLGPLKLLHFGRAVNVTLGLPYPRTSVDHGTAYDVTGKDTADTTSLVSALALAGRLIG